MTDARDIVERLRAWSYWKCSDGYGEAFDNTPFEAADTIASLRKQLEDARSEALEEAAKAIENMGSRHDSTAGERYAKVIRALKGQP